MSDQELCLLPITELSARIQRRSLSPVELTDAHLARIERLDGPLHSYITVTADRARADARRAEEELARGISRGPLHGIPIAVKDLYDTAGILTTSGSKVLRDRVPSQDCTASVRLRAAGTVLLGKLSMHEFAMGPPRRDDYFPPARNPWDTERIPGGSSSGSGAALVAGLCAGSMGSDTGGSIRNPASYCGIVGLKPTYGLVSRRGVIALSWTLDHAGPMARTVADTALLLQATAGHDPADPASAQVPIPDYSVGLNGSAHGVRIGVPMAYVESAPGMEPDVFSAFRRAIDTLRELGAEVREVAMPSPELSEPVQTTIMLSEAAAYHHEWLRTRRDDYSPNFFGRLMTGTLYTAVDYVQAMRGRALLCRQFEELIATVDLIAMPSTPRTAPTFAEDMTAPASSRGLFTRIFNVTGQPAISIPCGFDGKGLPIGLMLTGRAFDEPTVLRVADAYERATDWHLRRPPTAA